MTEKVPTLDYEPRRPGILRVIPRWLRRALLVTALVAAAEALMIGMVSLLNRH